MDKKQVRPLTEQYKEMKRRGYNVAPIFNRFGEIKKIVPANPFGIPQRDMTRYPLP